MCMFGWFVEVWSERVKIDHFFPFFTFPTALTHTHELYDDGNGMVGLTQWLVGACSGECIILYPLKFGTAMLLLELIKLNKNRAVGCVLFLLCTG